MTVKASATTTTDPALFSNLAARSREIAETLRLNRDEAGQFDRKLPPGLVAMIAQAVDALKDPSTRVDAERFLGAEILEEVSPVDVMIAILRRSEEHTSELQSPK